jgi:hypothetical protein
MQDLRPTLANSKILQSTIWIIRCRLDRPIERKLTQKKNRRSIAIPSSRAEIGE